MVTRPWLRASKPQPPVAKFVNKSRVRAWCTRLWWRSDASGYIPLRSCADGCLAAIAAKAKIGQLVPKRRPGSPVAWANHDIALGCLQTMTLHS
eukprot:6653405-Prymnesium_polylepis.1